MIKNIRKSIDFALFTATPSSWDTSSSQQSKLGTYLQLCQDQINGMAIAPNKVDPNSQAKLKELKSKIKAKIAQLEKQKTSVSKSDKKELDLRIKELKEAEKEIEVIINSSTNYVFQTAAKPQFTYDKNKDTGVIKYDGSIGSLINEIKHAFQFESGQIDFFHDKNNLTGDPIPGLTYDVYDEIETYKRQYAYDGILKFTVALSKAEIIAAHATQKARNSLGIGRVDIKRMKDVKVDVIIKVADSYALDPLYDKLARKPLGISSSVKEVVNANKKRSFSVNSLGISSFDQKKSYIEFVKVYVSQSPYLYVKY